MKTKYFKNSKSYFNFINKNRNKKIKCFSCVITENNIKVIYEFV